MTVTSMTGFARVEGRLEIADGIAADWAWEIKSVNAKGLDIRFRWPPGYDHVEASARTALAEHLGRGAVTANATLSLDKGPATLTVNEAWLDQIRWGDPPSKKKVYTSHLYSDLLVTKNRNFDQFHF